MMPPAMVPTTLRTETMTDIKTLSAAKLVALYNLITDGKPRAKFESTPAGLRLTLAEIARLGLTEEQAMSVWDRAAPTTNGSNVRTLPEPAPLPAPTQVNLLTGDEMPRRPALHDPIRTVSGDAKKAAKVAAKAATETVMAERRLFMGGLRTLGFRAPVATPAPERAVTAPAPTPAAKAPRKPVSGVDGPARSNATVPAMLAAMRTTEGATLAELTVIAGWRAPVEVRNLRLMEKKRGVTIIHDGQVGAGRRYRIV
jgi:hypothetical protein